jgi:type II secretory pathway component PulM
MKKYFSQLRPLERRLAIGVLVLLFLVLNYVFVWPHFSDWGNLGRRGDDARRKLKLYQTAIAQTATYEAQVKSLESSGEVVPPEDMAVNMLRTIQSQSAQSGVGIVNTSRQITHTNDVFFVELQPDTAKQHLNANIRLVASYQKNATADNLKPATAKAK